MKSIYLDNNSTTVIAPEVADAMTQCYQAGFVNPASQHQLGQKSRRRLEQARESIAGTLGCEITNFQSDSVIFTSGGTEANNLALFGLLKPLEKNGTPGNLVISGIEHPSIIAAADILKQRGYEIRIAPTNQNGVIDTGACIELIDDQTELVSIMLGNNETGILQPVSTIARACKQKNVLIHTDAVQVVGKLSVNFRELEVDALTLTAHKLHGPRGIGALITKHSVELQPQLHGGFQQLGTRPGTEPVELAVGFQTALELCSSNLEFRRLELCNLRDQFESELKKRIPSIVVNSAESDRLPHTSNIAFIGVDRQALVMALDMAGICCSTGSACASGSSEPSPVLQAMNCPDSVISSSLRFSFSQQNTQPEVIESVERISNVINSLR